MFRLMLLRLLRSVGAGGPVPPAEAPDVCLTATRTYYVRLTASTEHARQCDGGSMTADAALRQSVEVAPTPTGYDPIEQLWEFTLPAAEVPAGGIGAWVIEVKFAPSPDRAAVKTYPATVTQGGTAGTLDAIFEITIDTADFTGITGVPDFTYGSTWAWTAWRTDSGQREQLAGCRLLGSHVVS